LQDLIVLRDSEITLRLRQGLNFLKKSAIKNIWTMSESLIQKYFINEEGVCRKVFSANNDL
jgi:hypothetical protein